jgi:GNAT superfamily N-acetyltransferase
VKVTYGEYEIDDSPERINFDRVHSWLASSYWSPGLSRDTVDRAALNSSLLVAAYFNEEQVGYLRVISDKATFAWIADVWVAEEHRRKGLALAMVRFAVNHSEHQGLRRWILATRDAHQVYRKAGFRSITDPERWMIFRP